MRRYKYQAMVAPLPHGGRAAALTGPTCRMVVKAQHRETHATKMFNALVTLDEFQVPGHPSSVTVIVLGDDAGDYLAPGEHFELWRGGDLGSCVVTRRIFV